MNFTLVHKLDNLYRLIPNFSKVFVFLFEDIIVQLIRITDDGTNDSLKKKKIKRATLKN